MLLFPVFAALLFFWLILKLASQYRLPGFSWWKLAKRSFRCFLTLMAMFVASMVISEIAPHSGLNKIGGFLCEILLLVLFWLYFIRTIKEVTVIPETRRKTNVNGRLIVFDRIKSFRGPSDSVSNFWFRYFSLWNFVSSFRVSRIEADCGGCLIRAKVFFIDKSHESIDLFSFDARAEEVTRQIQRFLSEIVRQEPPVEKLQRAFQDLKLEGDSRALVEVRLTYHLRYGLPKRLFR